MILPAIRESPYNSRNLAAIIDEIAVIFFVPLKSHLNIPINQKHLFFNSVTEICPVLLQFLRFS